MAYLKSHKYFSQTLLIFASITSNFVYVELRVNYALYTIVTVCD